MATRQQRHELAVRQGGFAQKVSKPDETHAGYREVEKEVGAIRADRSLHRDHHPLAGIKHRPLCQAREATQLQAIVPREIGGLLGNSIPLQISRARGNDAPDFAEANRDQRAIGQRTNADRYVDLVRNRIDPVVADGKIDRDLRILIYELRQQPREPVPRKRRPAVDPDMAARSSMGGGNVSFGRLYRRKDLA